MNFDIIFRGELPEVRDIARRLFLEGAGVTPDLTAAEYPSAAWDVAHALMWERLKEQAREEYRVVNLRVTLAEWAELEERTAREARLRQAREARRRRKHKAIKNLLWEAEAPKRAAHAKKAAQRRQDRHVASARKQRHQQTWAPEAQWAEIEARRGAVE